MYDLKSIFGLSLSVVYVDHGIREDAERQKERALVRKHADNLNLKLYEKIVPAGFIEHVAKAHSRSIEDAARDIRYAFFDEIIKAHGIDYVATAHNLDDQIETVFMRVVNGSDIFGLRGIPSVRLPFVRPFLSCSKDEILAYDRERALEYVVDSTNISDDYLRNKIRNTVLPFLKEQFPGLSSSLLALSQKAAIFSYELEQKETRLLWQKDFYGYYIDYNDFLSASQYERYVCIYSAFSLLNQNITNYELPFKHIHKLITEPDRIESIRLVSGRGFYIERCGDRLYIMQELAYGLENGYFVQVNRPGRYTLGMAGLIDVDFFKYGENGIGTFSLPCFNDNGVIIRSKKPGDSIRLGKGKKAVNKLLQEWNVPLNKRGLLPVVEDFEFGIIAVLGSVFPGGKNIICHGLPVCDRAIEIKFLQER